MQLPYKLAWLSEPNSYHRFFFFFLHYQRKKRETPCELSFDLIRIKSESCYVQGNILECLSPHIYICIYIAKCFNTEPNTTKMLEIVFFFFLIFSYGIRLPCLIFLNIILLIFLLKMSHYYYCLKFTI